MVELGFKPWQSSFKIYLPHPYVLLLLRGQVSQERASDHLTNKMCLNSHSQVTIGYV